MFFIFGGEFPGTDFIPRLYTFHVLLVPGILLALIGLHLVLVFYHKHTQYPGAGRTNTNVVGYPLFPVYVAKAGGFFFVVFGVTVIMAAIATINPIWAYGPYVPDQVTAGSQPDWYIGFLDGMLRAFPNWETTIWGYTISWNVFIPAAVMPGILITVLIAYPFIEAWVTGDRGEHHILDRPRNAATRTALGAMAISFYGILVINGANDIIAVAFNLSINQLTWFTRIAVFVVPPLVFIATRRFCLGLQRRDRELLLHGRESGQILRLPHGEFIEIHTPISDEEKAVILAKDDIRALEAPPATDENGVATPKLKCKRRRAKWSRFFYGDNVATPTAAEIAEAEHHAHVEHDHEVDELAEAGKDVPAVLGKTPTSATTRSTTAPALREERPGPSCVRRRRAAGRMSPWRTRCWSRYDGPAASPATTSRAPREPSRARARAVPHVDLVRRRRPRAARRSARVVRRGAAPVDRRRPGGLVGGDAARAARPRPPRDVRAAAYRALVLRAGGCAARPVRRRLTCGRRRGGRAALRRVP